MQALVGNRNFVARLGAKLRMAREHALLKREQAGRESGVDGLGTDSEKDSDEEEGRELGSDEDPWSDSDEEAGDYLGAVDFDALPLQPANTFTLRPISTDALPAAAEAVNT